MQVERTPLVNLFTALGVDNAAEWPPKTLAEKVNKGPKGIGRYRDEGQALADEHVTLFEQMVGATERGEAIEVKGPAESDAPPAPAKNGGKGKKGAGKGKKAAAKKATTPAPKTAIRRSPPVGASYAEQKEWYRKHPITPSERGPGIMRTVLAELRRAAEPGRGKPPAPVTKEFILDVLVREFGSATRTREKMATNLNNIIPGRLARVYGIHVWRGRLPDGLVGYYLPAHGKPQPEADSNIRPTAGESGKVTVIKGRGKSKKKKSKEVAKKKDKKAVAA